MKNVIGKSTALTVVPIPCIGELRAEILALIVGNILFTDEQQLRANHNVHACENRTTLTKWLANTREEAECRAMYSERMEQMRQRALAAAGPAATPEQCGALYQLSRHPAISAAQQAQIAEYLPILNIEEATALLDCLSDDIKQWIDALPADCKALSPLATARQKKQIKAHLLHSAITDGVRMRTLLMIDFLAEEDAAELIERLIVLTSFSPRRPSQARPPEWVVTRGSITDAQRAELTRRLNAPSFHVGTRNLFLHRMRFMTASDATRLIIEFGGHGHPSRRDICFSLLAIAPANPLTQREYAAFRRTRRLVGPGCIDYKVAQPGEMYDYCIGLN